MYSNFVTSNGDGKTGAQAWLYKGTKAGTAYVFATDGKGNTALAIVTITP